MPTLGSLFSGFGLLDLGLTRAGFDVIWHAESTPAACRVLEHRWPGVPNLGDVTKIDWSTVERPDVVAGGFPCPPFSTAGKRLGRDDPRYLWPEVARCLRELGPRGALLENVAALLTVDGGRIFADILGDLSEAGFDAEWTVVRASDLGAPHRRERVFIAAHARSASGREVARSSPGDESEDGPHRADVARSGGEAPAPDPQNHDSARSGITRGRRGGPANDGATAPDADRTGRSGSTKLDGTAGTRLDGARQRHPDGCGDDARWGPYALAIARWERIVGERAPDPLDERGRLNVELTRWMMGAPPGWHGDLSRTAALRGYGNGVVVQVGEAAGKWLMAVVTARFLVGTVFKTLTELPDTSVDLVTKRTPSWPASASRRTECWRSWTATAPCVSRKDKGCWP